MYLNDLLEEKKMSKYRLAKESGVPQTTVADICSEKANIEKCSAETIYKIAKVLNVSMESLIQEKIETRKFETDRLSFEVYKSNVCHLVKDKGDVEFIIETLSKDEVRNLYNRKWYREAFYLLAMIDYLSKENDVQLCEKYNDIRTQKLSEIVYPEGVVLSDMAMKTDKYRKESLKNAIPEFLRFNIVESEVRNVC
ncbi:MAG: helix-turn-helix transcriptional regulator [Lachnospiraceae bacterium]|nr:helix-turn-helix transcriptional regulator [Lachnospiraceae bacterium]